VLNESLRKKVVDLRRGGKTIRQIANELGKSSPTIIAILKDEKLLEMEAELRAKDKEKMDIGQTEYTEALKLFSKGKSILDVTIKLGIAKEEAKRAYIDFLDLQTCEQFGKDYNQFREHLPILLSLHKMVIEQGLDLDDTRHAIKYVKNRAKAEIELQSLLWMINELKTQESMRIRNILPSMLRLATRLPSLDPDGMPIVQNMAFKIFVSKMADGLGPLIK